MALTVTRIASQETLFVQAPGSPFSIENSPSDVALSDVTGDRHLDVVTAHSRNRAIAVLSGDGTGTFTRAHTRRIALSYPPSEIVLGDVDADGRIDIAVTNHDSYDIDILLGNGTGGFSAAPDSPFAASAGGRPHTHGVALVDVNRDGTLDVVVGNNEDNNLAVLLGDGRGRFSRAPRSPFAVGPSPYPFDVKDLDRDDNLDIVVPSSGTGPGEAAGRVLTLLRGNGRGDFAPAPASPVPVAPNPHFVAVADLNGDTHPDIATSHNGGSLLSVLMNDGKGAFTPAPGSPFALAARGFTVVAVDVNGDRRSDLVVGTGAGVAVFLGNDRTVTSAPGSPYPAGTSAWHLAVGDINEDGKPDIAVVDYESSTLTVLLRR